MSHLQFMLPAIAGVAVLLAGIIALERGPKQRTKMEWFVAMGMALYASPLAAFGVEHFMIPRGVASLIPSWIPAHLFIAYFVGVALIAASLSFISQKQVRWAALCLGIMFLLFVCLMHVPGAIAHPGDRNFRIVALRDSAFGISAFALYLHMSQEQLGSQRARLLLRLAQGWVALVVLAFGIIQLFHPECSPGVPSMRVTPSWVPLPLILSYVTGGMLVVLGLTMLYERTARVAAVTTAVWMTALTVFLYGTDACFFLPSSQGLLGVNYVFDTMLFGGAMLLVARTLPVVPVTAPEQGTNGALFGRRSSGIPLG